MSPRPQLVTADDVAEILAESLVTVRRRTRRGDYAAFAINVGTDSKPRWRYDLHRLQRWLDVKRTA